MHNEKVKKVYADSFAKMDQLLKKHGVKVVGGYAAMMEHLFVAVYEAPSMDALLKFTMEPEFMNWNGYNETVIQPAMTTEEAMKMLK
jgi:uncharacterized protein with GYD domain